jgi:hypothetical protein
VAAAASPTAPLPVVVHIDASQQLVPFGGLSYSIQPAVAPTSDDWDNDSGSSAKNGAEYFLSALQFVDTFDNRIAVWAITNTRSLGNSSPSISLSFAVISSETYGQPNPAAQKAGETPLGVAVGEPEELLNTNDDRMNQVVFADGTLYGGVNSLLKVGGAEQQGIAWFGVQPRFDGLSLKGRVVGQGYVAVPGADVLFPSVALDNNGNGVIAFSLSGAKYFRAPRTSTWWMDMICRSSMWPARGKIPRTDFPATWRSAAEALRVGVTIRPRLPTAIVSGLRPNIFPRHVHRLRRRLRRRAARQMQTGALLFRQYGRPSKL